MADARIARQRLAKATGADDAIAPPAVPDDPDRAHALGRPGVPAEGLPTMPVADADAGFQGNANQLVRYVPTEILGAYVAFVALLAPLSGTGCSANYSSRWHVYLIFLGVTPLVQWLIYRARARQASERPEFPLAECVIATIAFAAWAAALPNAPLLDFCGWTSEWAIAVAAAVAVLLVLVSNAFGLGLRTQSDSEKG